MHALYGFVSGPLVWAAFITFIGGSCYRLVTMAQLARQRDAVVLEYMSARFALRSILKWLTPYSAMSMRKRPMTTFVAFAFHICAILAPLFVYAHVILVKESWNIGWWTLPDAMADMMCCLVIAGCLFFLFRRLTQPEIRYLTTTSDYLLLSMVAAPFVTGFWAYHQLPGAAVATILHMLSGEILLAAIPYTRISHMFFFFFTRGYIGSEFGAVRHAHDW
jgi:nitrate reductase gamma subunit